MRDRRRFAAKEQVEARGTLKWSSTSMMVEFAVVASSSLITPHLSSVPCPKGGQFDAILPGDGAVGEAVDRRADAHTAPFIAAHTRACSVAGEAGMRALCFTTVVLSLLIRPCIRVCTSSIDIRS